MVQSKTTKTFSTKEKFRDNNNNNNKKEMYHRLHLAYTSMHLSNLIILDIIIFRDQFSAEALLL